MPVRLHGPLSSSCRATCERCLTLVFVAGPKCRNYSRSISGRR